MRTIAAALLLPLVVVPGCTAHTPPAGEAPGRGVVSARLVAGDRALPGATIFATRDLGIAFGEETVQRPSGEDGTAVLELPAGLWYLTAFAADGSLFGYYGPNPVQVRPGSETPAAIRGGAGHRRPRELPAGEGPVGVEGVVTSEKGPLPGAVVAFYLDASTLFRGPAYVELPVDDEGRFAAFLSPGRYFIVVRKRAVGPGRFGPLARGDHFGYYAYNPVVVAEGQRLAVAVGAVEVQRRTGWTASSVSRLRLSGIISDPDGRPLAGYSAFLHSDPAMLGKPAFVSEASDAAGRYEIWVDREGAFFLGARREIGRPRELDEAFGRYRGAEGSSVPIALEGGEMTGYDIVVEGPGGL